jgi:hypothetical protein
MKPRKPGSDRARAAATILDRHANGEPLAPGSADEAAFAAIAELLNELPANAWQPIPAGPQRSAHRPRLVWRRAHRFVTAAVVGCFGLGVAAGSLLHSGTPSPRVPSGREVTLRPLRTSITGAAFAELGPPDQLTLRVAHLPPSPSGTYYELWLMTNLKHLAPVASFRVGRSGHAQLTLILPNTPDAYKYLDISLQRLGTGTEHSADSVLRGPLT